MARTREEIIEVGDLIRDKNGVEGIVEENTHPWGFKRLQYNGLSIINHPDKDWYTIIKKFTNLNKWDD